MQCICADSATSAGRNKPFQGRRSVPQVTEPLTRRCGQAGTSQQGTEAVLRDMIPAQRTPDAVGEDVALIATTRAVD